MSTAKQVMTFLAAVLASASLASAQTSVPPALPAPTPDTLSLGERGWGEGDGSLVPGCCDCQPGCNAAACTRIWGSIDYLLWWVKSAPLSVPLLTTFAPNSPSAKAGAGGELGVAGTTILSPEHLGFDPLSGGRVVIGGWIDCDQHFGLEASGFLTQTQTANSTILSNANGSPSLRVPFFNPPPGAGFPLGESSFVLSEPGFANGGQTLSSTLRLWDAEGHALLHIVDGRQFSVSLLGGFQYLDLQEGLSIADRESLVGGGGFGSYVGTDLFSTRNQFYGGQMGAKAEYHYGRLSATVLGDVALGVNDETVTINGYSSVTKTGGRPVITTGGIFSQTTNIGRQNEDMFAVVPEVQFRMGVDLTRSISAFVGYDFLYLSNAVRPGDQLDRVINFTSNSAVNGSPSTLTGAARPGPIFDHTDFWAQGISFGLTFRY